MSDAETKLLTGAYPHELEVFTRNGIKAALVLCGGDETSAGWRVNPKTGKPHDVDEQFATKIALCHSELSEALEGHRKNKMDDHLPHRPSAEVELADTLIRIFSLAQWKGYDLSGAMMEKLEYNRKRADHKLENRRQEDGKAY